MTRSHRTRGKAALLALLGAGLLLPGAAWARDGHRHPGHASRHHAHDAHRGHHGPHGRAPVFHRGRACGYRHARHAQPRPSYACRPCGHRFGDRRAFYAHLAHHHHVPAWRVPWVVVHHGFSWVFYG